MEITSDIILKITDIILEINMVKDFPSSPLERVMRKAGADRVSNSAVQEMLNILLEITDRIASEATAAARHAKRVTVKREDIVLVTRKDRLGK